MDEPRRYADETDEAYAARTAGPGATREQYDINTDRSVDASYAGSMPSEECYDEPMPTGLSGAGLEEWKRDHRVLDDPSKPAAVGEVRPVGEANAQTGEQPQVTRKDGESDQAYQQRVDATNAQAKADREQADAAQETADKQAQAAKDGITGHPSGIPAAAAFWERIQSAKFALRELGHHEVTSLLDELYAGLQRVEGTATGNLPAIPEGAPQQPGESDADYQARQGNA